MDWLDARVDGVRLTIRLTPRARRNAVLGVSDTADGDRMLKVVVTAAPEGGKANEALIKLLAKQWHLAKSDIRLISGHSARTKVLQIDGPPGTVAAAIRGSVEAVLENQR